VMVTDADQSHQEVVNNAATLVTKAEPLQTKHNKITKVLADVRKIAKDGRVNDTTAIDRHRKEMETALRKKAFDEFDSALDRVNDEGAKIQAYADAVDEAQARINALPQKDQNAIQMLRQKFVQAVGAKPRDDAIAAQALQAFDKAVQDVLDREEAKAIARAADQDAAEAARAVRLQKRADGLLPDNGEYEIRTTTRAEVGTPGAEHDAVIEALDALKNPTKPHLFARKWGEYHGNGEGNLPGRRGLGGYKEYYVRPESPTKNIRRLVVADATGFVYYSPNHYGSVGDGDPFVKVTNP